VPFGALCWCGGGRGVEHLLRVFHVHVVILHRHVSVTPLTFLRVSYNNTSTVCTQQLYLILVCVCVYIYIYIVRILIPHPGDTPSHVEAGTGYGWELRGSILGRTKRHFPSPKVQTAMRPSHLAVYWVQGVFGRDADHSPPSSAEVENEWSCASSGHIALMLRVQLFDWCKWSFRVCFLRLWKNGTLLPVCDPSSPPAP